MQDIQSFGILLPATLALYLGYNYANHTDSIGIILVLAGAIVGIDTGLVSAQLVRVWRDANSGLIYQRSGLGS